MKKKYKLMQITHDLAIGGLQQVVVNICRVIDKERFDVSVLCLRELGEYVPELEKLGVKVSLLPKKEKGTDYLAFLKVAKILREENIDIIHTHNTQPFFDGTIAAKLAGVRCIIHTDHARKFPDKRRYMFAEWVMSLFAYRVVGVSDHTTENLRRYEKISKSKLVTIVNGIDENKYNIKIDKAKKRQEIGIKNGGYIIGLCVRLSEQKGITYLLDALPAIIKRYPDVTLVIAGEGDLENALKQKAGALNIAAHVAFIGTRLDIPELLKLFDLYVLPSLWEGLPMGIIEAMASGCPVVATDVGGVNMAIENNVNGMLVEPKDPDKLSAAIIKLLDDEKAKTDFINRSYEIFNSRFSARIMTKRYEDLYDAAIENKYN